MIKALPNLEKLDDVDISPHERQLAMNLNEHEIATALNKKAYVQTSFNPSESQQYKPATAAAGQPPKVSSLIF